MRLTRAARRARRSRYPPEGGRKRGEILQEGFTQEQNVLVALAQSRQPDLEHLEPVVKVLPDCAGFHGRTKVPVRGCDDTDVGLHDAGAAKSLILSLLEHTQELGLRRRTHLAHFVEEENAAAGLLDLSGLRLKRAGEGAPLVAEELGFEQRLG